MTHDPFLIKDERDARLAKEQQLEAASDSTDLAGYVCPRARLRVDAHHPPARRRYPPP
jgi:hypothetical protein